MKTVLLIVCILCLSGCEPSEQGKQQAEKEKVKKNIMGDGNKPMPNPADYK